MSCTMLEHSCSARRQVWPSRETAGHERRTGRLPGPFEAFAADYAANKPDVMKHWV
jgi:hypothetical protein